MFKLVELFKSIQSEGYHAGTPANFIRLYGCNLQCKFGDGKQCDEPLHTDSNCIVPTSVGDIVEFCKGLCHVVITGGEPSLNNLQELIGALHKNGHYVQIETNGYNLDNIKRANWITYSPKFMWDVTAPALKTGFHELKLLGSEKCPPNIKSWDSVKRKYLQPIGDENGWDLEDVRWCAQFVVDNAGWKLSLQTHKIYGVQ
jgi:7-carboxy-7-deazaguanine synthase